MMALLSALRALWARSEARQASQLQPVPDLAAQSQLARLARPFRRKRRLYCPRRVSPVLLQVCVQRLHR